MIGPYLHIICCSLQPSAAAARDYGLPPGEGGRGGGGVEVSLCARNAPISESLPGICKFHSISYTNELSHSDLRVVSSRVGEAEGPAPKTITYVTPVMFPLQMNEQCQSPRQFALESACPDSLMLLREGWTLAST